MNKKKKKKDVQRNPPIALSSGVRVFLQKIGPPVPVSKCLCGAWYHPKCPVVEHQVWALRETNNPPADFWAVSMKKRASKQEISLGGEFLSIS